MSSSALLSELTCVGLNFGYRLECAAAPKKSGGATGSRAAGYRVAMVLDRGVSLDDRFDLSRIHRCNLVCRQRADLRGAEGRDVFGLETRMPTEDARFFCTAIRIQRGAGGNLAEILDRLAEVIRERFKILSYARVLSSQHRWSAVCVGLSPAVFAVVFELMHPGYFDALATNPIGPWLVTTDEIRDPQALDMWLDLNGKRMQSGNTRTMIFGVARCVSDVSQYMTLLPGDIICTGTPPGVGLGVKPNPVFLKPGDVMTLGIRGLGEQRQKVVAFSS